jgi:hypothetical protein
MTSCLDDWRGFGDDGWVNYEARIGEVVGHLPAAYVLTGQRDLHLTRSQDAGIACGGCDLFYYESDGRSRPPNMGGQVQHVREHGYCGCEGCCLSCCKRRGVKLKPG